MTFTNSKINKLDVYDMSFAKEIDFHQTKVDEYVLGAATLRGQHLYMYNDDEGKIIQTNVDPQEIKRIYQNIVSEIKNSENPQSVDIASLCEGYELSADQIKSLQATQYNRAKEIEITRIKEEQRRKEQERIENERRQEEAYQQQLKMRCEGVMDEVLGINPDKLSAFRDEYAKREGFDIRMEDVVALQQVAKEREDKKRADFYKRENLREIFYDVIAEVITDDNGEVCCTTVNNDDIRQTIYDYITEDIGDDANILGEWYNFNLTDNKLGDNADVFGENLAYMEKTYVLPDIQKNDGILDFDCCYYDRQDKKPSKTKDEKRQEKINTAASAGDLRQLAEAFGGNCRVR